MSLFVLSISPFISFLLLLLLSFLTPLSVSQFYFLLWLRSFLIRTDRHRWSWRNDGIDTVRYHGPIVSRRGEIDTKRGEEKKTRSRIIIIILLTIMIVSSIDQSFDCIHLHIHTHSHSITHSCCTHTNTNTSTINQLHSHSHPIPPAC